MVVYRPVTGGSPASSAYASPCGTRIAARTMPATRSKRSHAGLYVRSMPTPGTTAFSRLFLRGPASVVSAFVATLSPACACGHEW